MAEILDAYPGAQRAMMRRYHIGGCGKCGFAPSDRLGDVLAKHDVNDVEEVLEHLRASGEQEEQIQIEPRALADELGDSKAPRLIDVRPAEEAQLARIEGSVQGTQALFAEMMNDWPKDTPIVTYCHRGLRSLDAASHLIGHGFTNVRSLKGGVDAWATDIDPSIARY